MKCPSCSAPLPYDQRFATLVVCSHCHSAVIFDDAAARVAGKMAVLTRPQSGLYVGATGKIGKDLAFRCLGRVRYAYGRGFWDEWYLQHDGQDTSWLSEDEQTLTHDRPKRHQLTREQLQTIVPGAKLNIDGQDYWVTESDTAICEGGEGQLPFRIISGEKVPFFDLETSERSTATLEIEPDGTVKVFAGARIKPKDLHIDVAQRHAGDESFATPAPESRERVHYGSGEAVTIRCKHCGASNLDPNLSDGPISCQSCGQSLVDGGPNFPCVSCNAPISCSSPDVQSVHCPYCGTSQSVSKGKPTLLTKVAEDRSNWQQHYQLPLTLGDKAKFDGLDFMVVGYICYTEEEEGLSYSSDEYLLYNEQWGHRWLTCYETQWSLQCELETLPSVSPQELRHLDYHQELKIDGTTWIFYESGVGYLEWVQGEFPWVAEVGDRSEYIELISPPYMLVCERNETELEWSKYRYIERKELAEAFGKDVSDFPKPVGVGAAQPNTSKPFYNTARLLVILFAFAAGGLAFAKPGTPIKTLHFDREIFESEALSEPFEIEGDEVVHRIEFESQLDNEWVSLDWAVVSKDDKALFESAVDISYYHGVDHDGSWTEGSRTESQYFKLPKGEYRILITGVGGTTEVSSPYVKVPVQVTILQDAWRALYFIVYAVLFILLFVILSLLGSRHEGKRWSHTEDEEEDDDDFD